MLYFHNWALCSIHSNKPYSLNQQISFIIKPLAAAILASTVLPAFADDKTELSQAKIEETVVIGLKRPINRKDYAGAVTLIDNDQLTASSVSNVVDIASLVPGLFAQDTGSRNPTPIIMRGINFDGMTSNNLGGDTYTVASYLDNIALQGYYAPPQVILKDLQAVDVLRGPQGTLYGASSLSGLISYQTAKPVMNEFSLDLHARISQTAESDDINMDSDIIINAPIVDDLLAMRAMISYSENAGFIDNDVLLTGPEKDINDDNVTAGRLSFLLTPTERLSATLMLQKQTTQSGDFQADNPAITGKDYFSSTYYLQPMEGELSLADLEIQYTFDSFTLELTSNYYAYDLTQTTDITAFYQDLGYTVDFDGGDNGFTESDVNDEQSNIELRAISNWQGSVNGIVGLSYTKNNFDITSKDNLSDFPGTYKEVEYTFTQDQTLEDTALFGELTWQTTEALALTLGGRYFDYNDTAESCDAFYTDPLFCISEEVDDSHTSFKLAGMYQINQALSLYANIAEGFRRGGANPGVPADLASRRSYDPDTAVNYEFGLLGQLWQQRLQLAVGVFYIDWKDIQLISGEEAENGDYISYIANANDAISQGVELELTAILSDSFTLRGYYAYNDAELAEDAVSYNDVEGGGDNGYKGDRLPGSPKQQAQLALQFLQPWQAYVFDASLSGNYTGDVSTQLNSEHFGYNTLDSYTLFNARLGIAQAQWRLGLFADNLTNKRVVTAEDPGYFGPESALSYVVRPRTLGIDVRYGF